MRPLRAFPAVCAVLVLGCGELLGVDFRASSNARGDASVGPMSDASVGPDSTAGPPKLQAVRAAAYGGFARFDDGALWAWGFNGNGELGTQSTSPATTPVRVTAFEALGTVRAVEPGDKHTCVQMQNGDVYCVGDGTQGALGSGAAASSLIPLRVPLALPAVALASSNGFSCAILTDRTLWCWGTNAAQQLGNPNAPRSLAPVLVNAPHLSAPPAASGVALGYAHGCARNESGEVSCWGENAGLNAGIGYKTKVSAPEALPGLADAQKLWSGAAFGCALRRNSSLVCWGRNNEGQVGIKSVTQEPQGVTHVAGATDVVDAAVGAAHACFLSRDGQLWCWGSNFEGQLGAPLGKVTQSYPVRVANLAAVVGVTAGANHTCAWTADGAVYCWGSNPAWQLGNGTTTDSNTPVRVRQAW